MLISLGKNSNRISQLAIFSQLFRLVFASSHIQVNLSNDVELIWVDLAPQGIDQKNLVPDQPKAQGLFHLMVRNQSCAT